MAPPIQGGGSKGPGMPLEGKTPGKSIEGPKKPTPKKPNPNRKPPKRPTPKKPTPTPKKPAKPISTGKKPGGKAITTGKNPLDGRKPAEKGPTITEVPRDLAGKKLPAGLIATTGPPPGWFSWWQFQHDRYHRTSHLLPGRQDRPSGSIALPYDIERARAVGALESALRDPKPSVRQAAVIALGKIARPADGVLEPIRALLGDPKQEVRRAATLALGLLNQKGAQKLLRRLLRGSRGDRRLQAYALLGLGYTPQGSQQVLPILRNSGDRELVIAALLGLKAAADPRVLPTLLAVAQNQSQKEATRALAISAAAGLDPQGSSIPILERLARDNKRGVATAALLTLGSIRLPAAKLALRRLMAAGGQLKDAHRGWLLLAVGQQRDKTQRTLIEASLKNTMLTGYAAIALGLLGDKAAIPALLKEESRYHRNDHLNHAAIVLGLGLLGAPELVTRLPDIWAACGDYHEYLQIVAAAVGHLGHKSQIPALVKQFEDHPWSYAVRRSAVVSLCMLDASGKAVALLRTDVKSKASLRRIFSARLLGELPKPSQVTRVMANVLRQDKHDEVRAQAAVALGRSLDRSRWEAPRMGALSRLGITFPYQIIRKEDLLKELFGLQ
ncbi:HEAT repeat domain-containing protein [bacterium AH-315-M10]|nr:HEAT repeat domain-containing protein [bacterium AH-315-M10]